MRSASEPMSQHYLEAKRNLEINPYHPIMKKLLDLVEKEEFDQIEQVPDFLFEVYSIASGYDARKPSVFADRVEKVFRVFLGVGLDAFVEDHIVPAPLADKVSDADVESRIKEGEEKKKARTENAEIAAQRDAKRLVQEAADEADRAAGIKKKKQPKIDMEEVERLLKEADAKEAKEAKEAESHDEL